MYVGRLKWKKKLESKKEKLEQFKPSFEEETDNIFSIKKKKYMCSLDI